jgi:two-component system, NtrC family, sensor histidine kinase PilS
MSTRSTTTSEGTSPEALSDFTQSRSQLVIIETVRLGFVAATLAIIVGFQAVQPDFVNVEWVLPVYFLMFFVFASNGIYLALIDRAIKGWVATAALFALEAVYITGLIFFTGVNQSIFLFLYLVNIILCGFVFQRKGALLMALFTSALFSALVLIGPEIKGQTLFFAVGLNNFAFFSVALLSGILSEQLNFMGSELVARGRDLRALRDLNNIIVDNIATGLMTLDSLGSILQVNKAGCLTLDYRSEQLIGHNVEEILPGFLKQLSILPLEQEGLKRSERFDYNLLIPGNEKVILGMMTSLFPLGSTTSGYIITFQDLTSVRRLEFAMRQSEKMAAVGQLAAGIAHEIRNPLASISGSIQLLGADFISKKNSLGEASEESRLMQIVLREIDRLNNLITEFLEFVRPDAQRDDPVDISQLVREVIDILDLNRTLRQDTEKVLRLESKKIVLGHKDKLKQALINIIMNAYQAMKETAASKIEISTQDRGNDVVLKIKDHGCGIDERNIRKIFEPFHTTKPKGTGLGLAVTHKIIENHGGRIFVESTKGQGTEFTIEFPIRSSDKLNLADSKQASDDFSTAFKGQKRGSA